MNQMTSFLKRHSLFLGIVLMFLLTWPLDLVNTGIIKVDLPFILLLFLGWGFGITSVIMTGLTLGKRGVIMLLKRYLIWRVNWKWYLAAFLLKPLLIVLGVYGNALISGVAPDFSGIMAYKLFGKDATLWLFVLPFLLVDFIANGEEIGWRGYVLPRLQAKYTALVSSLILGAVWGLWHLLKFLPHWNTILFALFMLHIIAFAVTQTWLYNNTKGSLLLVTIMHASSNTAGIFFPMASTTSSENLGAYIGYVLFEVLAAVIIVLITGPEHLSRTEQKQVQEDTYEKLPGRNSNTNIKTYPSRILNSLKRSLVRMPFIALIIGTFGTVYQTAATETDQRNYPAPGNLIDVGGFKMHIHCEGEGSPTVILEAMSGGMSPYWGWIQPEIKKETRVCVYDRAGFGWSEPDPEPPSLARTVRNLHTLLENANIEGPYVLVGHSLGGVYMRQFAANYPDKVAGVMLLDEANPQQFVKYPEMFAEGDNFLNILKVIKFLNHIGATRLYFALGGKMDFSELPEPQRSQVKAIWSTPQYFEAQAAEIAAAHEIWTDALNLKGLGDIPLVVVSRGINLGFEWEKFQADLAALSTNSLHITENGASHSALVFNPDYAADVSKAILQLVDVARTGKRLRG